MRWKLDSTKGELSRTRKLTSAQVRAIRIEFDAGEDPQRRAPLYRITAGHYRNVGRRKCWRSLEEPINHGGNTECQKSTPEI